MANSLSSPASIVNAALGRIGYKLRIGSLLDGSEASKVALDIYGQTRDDLIRDGDHGFARRQVGLVALKVAPAGGYNPLTPWNLNIHPPVPWVYEYGYPDDMLRLLSLQATPIITPVMSPRPVVYQISNDSRTVPPRRVILTNLPFAIASYMARVTDPLTFDVSFTELLIDALATNLSPALASLDVQKLDALAEAGAASTAEHLGG